MAKALSYDELIEYAKAHGDKGGDAIVKSWDKAEYDEHVRLFGPISKSKALALFREEREKAHWKLIIDCLWW